MTEMGKLVTCDRCGKTAFAKAESEIERDGGYTRVTVYAKLPNWSYERVINATMDLCPDCTETFREIDKRHKAELKSFIKKVEEKSE